MKEKVKNVTIAPGLPLYNNNLVLTQQTRDLISPYYCALQQNCYKFSYYLFPSVGLTLGPVISQQNFQICVIII